MARNLIGGLLIAAVGLVTAGTQSVGAQSVAGQSLWVNATGNLAYKLTECGNVSALTAIPDSDVVLAGIATRGLWANTGGGTWTRVGDGPGSDRIVNRPMSFVHDPTHRGVFWESGIYNGPGVYRTDDGGKTFKRLGSVTHNDSVSVDLRDPDRLTLLAGSHEQGQMVFRSVDGGETWKNVGATIAAAGASTYPLVIDALTYVVNASNANGGNVTGGIFRTIDGGASWEKVYPIGPAAPPLRASNGIIYWPARGRVLRSLDLGETWTAVGGGTRDMRLVELPDGRLVGVGEHTLMMSPDLGATWLPFGDALPYIPDGIVYSSGQNAFFAWKGDCNDKVPPNAIMKLDFHDPAAAVDRSAAR